MKLMKRMMTLAMALVMVLTLVSCGGGMSEGSRADGIFYEATGISPDAVLLRADGMDVTAERYFYWLYNAVGGAAMYCGADGFNSDAGDGRTYAQVCLDNVRETAKEYCLIEKWAKEKNLTLAEEDLAYITEQVDAYEESYGDFGFAYMGVTRETMEYLLVQAAQYNTLLEAVMVEGGALAPTEEEIAAYVEGAALLKADHILLSTKDEANQPLPEAEVEAKRALAEDILAQLQSAEDLEAAFKALGDEYSEDPGRAYYPDGYVFTDGEMVIEFESAAKALAVGEISGIVESDFGYHILLRKEILPEEVLTEEGYFIWMLQNKVAEMDVEFSEIYEQQVLTMDLGEFYTKVSDARDALYAEYEAGLKAETGADAEASDEEEAVG